MTPKTPPRRRGNPKAASPLPLLKFRLYVAGQTPRSLAAIANLQRICRDHCPGRKLIEVIDLLANPELAKRDAIVALPTLVKVLPKPVRIVIGDLSNTEKVLAGMDVQSVQGALNVS